MHNKYQKTIFACFTGCIVQAIVVNFAPLLFLTFQNSYRIPLSQITLLVTINFAVQLLVDLLSAGFVDKIGYRASLLIAHICAAAGLISMTVFPDIFPTPFLGLSASTVLYAIGSGILEVLISPIIESCPSDNKAKAMSLLHAFYCWGQVGVVLLSTLFFWVFGVGSWKILALIWSVTPIINALLFLKVPIAPLIKEGEKGLSIKELFCNKFFWLLMMMMVCSGASEQAIAQWASAFAEEGLKVSKTIGDLAGPMSFAVLMGVARTFYGKYGEKINLEKFMVGSGLLCIASYLCISLIPHPVLGLLGCSICGLSVGIMWPGTISKAAASLKGGGTAMFALLALGGDLGCSSGPTLVGAVSSRFSDNLKIGILAAVIFPLLLLVGLVLARKKTVEALSSS